MAWAAGLLAALQPRDSAASIASECCRRCFWVVPLHAAVFFAYGVNRGLWRYVSLKDMQRIVLAVALAAVLVGACVFMFSCAMCRARC
jgi:FlaA1/EpsC-like NDP-sugar epimerase